MKATAASVVSVSAILAVAGCDSVQEPDFNGVWSTSLTLGINEALEIADYACFAGCPVAVYEHLRGLLADPANDERPYRELMFEAWAHGGAQLRSILTDQGLARQEALGDVDQERLNCLPQGYIAQISNPLPVEITQFDDRVVMRYELWNVERTIWIDGRGHPDDLEPSRYGHSIGHYAGEELVVETTGVLPSRFTLDFGGGGHGEQLRTTERYSRSDDGTLLKMELTIEDPEMLRVPLVYEKVWRYTPELDVFEYECELFEDTGDV